MNKSNDQFNSGYDFLDEIEGEELDYLNSYSQDDPGPQGDHHEEMQSLEQDNENIEDILPEDNNQQIDQIAENNENPQLLESENGDTSQAESETNGGEQISENRQKTVPHQALHQERERHKDTKAELDKLRQEQQDLRRQFEVGNERLRMIAEMMQQQPQQEPEPEPILTPEEDIYGYNHQVGKQINDLQQNVERTQDAIQDINIGLQQQQQQNQIFNAYQQDASNFASQNQDFVGAYNHLIESRAQELAAMGMDVKEIPQYIQQEEIAVANNLFAQNKSPAEWIYNAAQLRGYQRAQDPSTENQNEQQDPALNDQNFQQPDNNQSAGQQNSNSNSNSQGMNTVANIANAKAASKTLSGAGGSEVNQMTMRTLARMSDEEFSKFLSSSKNKDEVRRLLGGPASDLDF